jgi:hypothetical protein
MERYNCGRPLRCAPNRHESFSPGERRRRSPTTLDAVGRRATEAQPPLVPSPDAASPLSPSNMHRDPNGAPHQGSHHDGQELHVPIPPAEQRIAYTAAWGEGPKCQLRRNLMPRLGALTWRWPRKSA